MYRFVPTVWCLHHYRNLRDATVVTEVIIVHLEGF